MHQTDIDPHILIDRGHGDRPLLHLRYTCTKCGSRRTNWVVAAKRTSPWNIDIPVNNAGAREGNQ